MNRAALALVAVVAISAGTVAVAQAQDLAPGRVTLRPDEVDKAASRRLRRVRGCYKDALERSSRTYGTIGVGMHVAPDGKVTDRWVALSTLADPKLETCIVDAFEGLEFPAPGGYGAVVRFGVLLKTDESPEAPLLTQEEAYKRAIRNEPAIGRPPPGSPARPLMPGFEGLDDREKFGPIETPAPPK